MQHPSQRTFTPLVAASVGPYGAYLADGSEYRGKYGLDESGLMHFHQRRLKTLLKAGPDLLALETIPSLTEARALIRLLKKFPEARAWISFTCCDPVNISDGTPFREVVREISKSPQVLAVGINCTRPEWVTTLLRGAAPVSSKPFVVYPNSGESWDADNHCWTGAGIQDWSLWIREWIRAGARIIGGCCRTTPALIREIKNSV